MQTLCCLAAVGYRGCMIQVACFATTAGVMEFRPLQFAALPIAAVVAAKHAAISLAEVS